MFAQHIHRIAALHRMHYPIGDNINLNLPIIRTMANTIKAKLFPARINLICVGSSGNLIAGVVASLVRINKIVVIKKDFESAHGQPMMVTGLDDVNLFIDDFLDSGQTLNWAMNQFNSALQRRKITDVMVSGLIPYRAKGHCKDDWEFNHVFCQEYDNQVLFKKKESLILTYL